MRKSLYVAAVAFAIAAVVVAPGCKKHRSSGNSSSGGDSEDDSPPSTPPPSPPPTPTSLHVLSPNGGEIWAIGQPASVSWTPGTTSSPVNLEVSLDGVGWTPLATGVSNDGIETVVVPAPPGETARVRVTETAAAASDTSDADFSIREPWENIGASIPGLRYSALAWGDYDNDGDLDLIMAGYTLDVPASSYVTRLYRNDAGAFVDSGLSLPSMEQPAFAWGDYDRDGDLDFAMAGYLSPGSGSIARIYRNDGGGTFVDIAEPLPPVAAGSLAWGDYDDDGDLDLAMAGYTESIGTVTRIMRNDGSDTFADSGIALPGVYQCTVAWGDYDADEDLDLALAGYDPAAGISRMQIYRNDGLGVFTDIAAGITGVYTSTVAWADYDQDGDLDLAVSGWVSPGGSKISRIYRNDGALGFNDIAAGLPALYFGWLSWGDLDNDGDFDLAVFGNMPGGGNTTRLYRYDGGTSFTDTGATLVDYFEGGIVWGDYDADGDLDLGTNGGDGTGAPESVIYRNNLASPNLPPGAPTGLAATPSPGAVSLSWSAPADDHTPAAGLTYGLRIGTSPGGADIVTPMSNLATGARRLPQQGFVVKTSASLNLPPGTYFWRVQAIDTALSGGAWSTEGTFTVP